MWYTMVRQHDIFVIMVKHIGWNIRQEMIRRLKSTFYLPYAMKNIHMIPESEKNSSCQLIWISFNVLVSCSRRVYLCQYGVLSDSADRHAGWLSGALTL